MRKTTKAAVVLIMVAVILFTFVPITVEHSYYANKAGFGRGQAMVSPSFYFLGCGSVYDWVSVYYQASWNTTSSVLAKWICGTNYVIWR